MEAACANPRVVLLTGDLGFAVLDEFRANCPRQFYNVGVAEQNLAGVAAGLALSGHIVFTYSIGNFPTLRCLEQVRNDICYHQADVKIVTVGGGLAYGSLGMSHFATEDLAILRALPELTVVAPGDPTEVEQLVPQIVARPGPVYLRLGPGGRPPGPRPRHRRRAGPADARARRFGRTAPHRGWHVAGGARGGEAARAGWHQHGSGECTHPQAAGRRRDLCPGGALPRLEGVYT